MKKIIPLIMFATLLLCGWFYWFQYRPIDIKHDCSWIHVHKDAKPEVLDSPKYTEKERQDMRILYNTPNIVDGIDWSKMHRNICGPNLECLDEIIPGHPAIPEENYWREANNEEYSFCLHEHGL